MRRVTRDVDTSDLHDLLERPARACIAHTGAGGPVARPVTLVWAEGRYLVGLPHPAARRPGTAGNDDGRMPGDEAEAPVPGDEAVLLVDEGTRWFDLRAVYVRGVVRAADPPTGADPGLRWLEITPERTVAWDYGALREVDGAR